MVALLDSVVDDLDDLSEAERLIRDGLLDELLDGMTDGEAAELATRWRFWRRRSQTIPPGMGAAYAVWEMIAGRGFGKTRTGAETTREVAEQYPLIALIGPTASDVRDIMIEGESGVLAVWPRDKRPHYEPSKRRVTFYNGSRAALFSADEPDRLRGPQHYWGWLDEPASYRYGEAVWDNFSFGLRLGDSPWALLTGTPKRQARWLRDLSNEPDTIVTSGSTYRNAANLSAAFMRRVLGRYEGTRLGRQELHAEWLDDVEGALWSYAAIDENRLDLRAEQLRDATGVEFRRAIVEHSQGVVDLSLLQERKPWRTVIAVDPPGSTAECGIAVGAAPTGGVAGVDHAVVLADESRAGRPEEWGQAVVDAYRRWNATAVYVEANQGGDMTRSTIHAVDRSVPVKKITARESKQARAEPIAALYDRGFVHHVGFMPELEDQQTSWVPGPGAKSPDRLDAVVHLLRELLDQRTFTTSRVASATSRRI